MNTYQEDTIKMPGCSSSSWGPYHNVTFRKAQAAAILDSIKMAGCSSGPCDNITVRKPKPADKKTKANAAKKSVTSTKIITGTGTSSTTTKGASTKKAKTTKNPADAKFYTRSGCCYGGVCT